MITERPEDTIVLLGGNVTFTCVAIGIPAPTITWSNEINGTINVISIDIMYTMTTSMLTLTDLASFYFNQSYTCTASNERGMAKRSAVLTEGSELGANLIHLFLVNSMLCVYLIIKLQH